jgi:hypothetical protein
MHGNGLLLSELLGLLGDLPGGPGEASSRLRVYEWHVHADGLLSVAWLLAIRGYMPGGHDAALSTRHAHVQQQWRMHRR